MAPARETSKPEGQIGCMTACQQVIPQNDSLQEPMTLPKSSYFVGTSYFNYAMNNTLHCNKMLFPLSSELQGIDAGMASNYVIP